MPLAKMTSETMAQIARMHLIEEQGATRKWLFEDNLNELRLFHATLEDFVEREEKRQVDQLSPLATHPDFWADHYPYQWQDVIGQQLRHSFVVSLASASEFHLGLLCGDVATVVQAPIDLKGGLISRSRKFLSAFAGFKAPNESAWQALGDLYVLRNCIAHNAALVEVDKDASRLNAFIARSPGISVPSAGLLEMKREFCTYALSAVESFFTDLHASFVALCQRVANDGV